MSTVGAVIDRLYRTWLYPPDNRPAQAHLATGIDDNDTTIVFQNFVLPEDEELLTVGTVIEMGSELMQLVEYDTLIMTGEAIRAIQGTTAVAHTAATPITLAPTYPRLSVFEAVADNIITLYPALYTVSASRIIGVSGFVGAIDDTLAVEVVSAWSDFGVTDIEAKIVDHHEMVGGRAVITNLNFGDIWLRYRRRMGDAQTEADLLADLGVEPRWVRIVMVGAAADLMVGRDIPAAQTKWVEATLQAENIPVGTRSSLATRLASYREYLLESAKKEMRAEYRAKSHMKDPVSVRTRSPFG